MTYRGLIGREYSWIIILSAFTQDVIANSLLKKAGITLLIYGSPISHGDFHTLAVLVFYAVGVSFLLHPLGIMFGDSLVFAAARVRGTFRRVCACVRPRVQVLWPVAMRKIGSGRYKNTIAIKRRLQD
ncbi:MAG: hypothetical protein WB392_11845 [Methanotrichaceae archaeon]